MEQLEITLPKFVNETMSSFSFKNVVFYIQVTVGKKVLMFWANFLDVSCSIKNDQLIFDIYYKPTHLFSHLHYRSWHSQHTKINIILSLGQRIIRIVSENKEQHLNKLKSYLIQHGHPEVLDYARTKLFSPSFKSQNESTDYVNFVQIYNPNT